MIKICLDLLFIISCNKHFPGSLYCIAQASLRLIFKRFPESSFNCSGVIQVVPLFDFIIYPDEPTAMKEPILLLIFFQTTDPDTLVVVQLVPEVDEIIFPPYPMATNLPLP